MPINNPIGVFDSGLGGLSVLSELLKQLPGEEYLYLGDTQRNPYGLKSAQTVEKYTVEAVTFLVKAGAKLIVIACNTATVAGLDTVQKAFPDIPIVGVVEPGCLAVAEVVQKHIVLLATQGTVKSGVHAARIKELKPDIKVSGVPAPILVALAEEGWLSGDVADAVCKRYLGDLYNDPDNAPDCLLLGCTHFPPFYNSIRKAVGSETTIVDPSGLTAQHVSAELEKHGILSKNTNPGKIKYLVTADPERFARIASFLLGKNIDLEDIKLINL